VTLAFAGDTNFQNQLGAVRSSPGSVLSPIAPVLSAADVAMLNLEAALGSGGTPAGKQFTFQVPEQAIDAVAAAGVDVVTMANNHGMDYGPGGLQDSLRIKRERGFPILGIGADDAEAYAPWVTEVKGQRIGFIAANDVFDSALVSQWTAGPGHPGLASAEEAHQDRLAGEIRALRPTVDTLVVFLHYGTETQTCPNERQRLLVRFLADAGADIVVGSHPHRLQGVGYHGQQFVAYSLGNFAFQANSAEGAATGVLTVTATGRRIDGYTWTPAVIRNSIPYPLTGPAAAEAFATMDQRQACAGLTPGPVPPTGGVP
jgi:poly-gamma-glutamate synthesis protein (capsule biosynthesis protein)